MGQAESLPAGLMHANGKQIPWTLVALLIGAGALLAAAALRGAEYDEGYTLLLAAGTPRPAWPGGVFTAGEARAVFAGHAGLGDIARALRATDVHPPLYFWTVAAWRWLAGSGLFGVRLLSVLCSVLSLALVGAIARLARVPPAMAILLTVGCYGFVYTGAIARDGALAQALLLAGVWLALRVDGGRWVRDTQNAQATPPPLEGLRWYAEPPAQPLRIALGAGLCLGAATLSNTLAIFVAGAALLWLLARPRAWLAAIAGFALFLPADLWFFLAQRNSRPGQFPAFSLIGSLPRLAQYTAANLLGGLPLYVPAQASTAVASGLASIVVLLAGLVALRWRCIGAARPRVLLTLGVLAPPVGLVLLGLAFNSTPIELRYLAFATPFAGLLLAGALGSLKRRWCLGLSGALLAIQAAALVGLMTRQETMQPARATAIAAAALADSSVAALPRGNDSIAALPRGNDTVVLLPRGNDGVGVVGAFVNEAPDGLRLSIAEQTDTIQQLDARLGGARRVVLALIGVDAASRATSTMLRATFSSDPCWRQAGIGFNVLAFDRICEGDQDVLRWLHADQDRGSGR
jgi:4-amino-4-deoxy-L-arabinose transferase-like glycosyltransferase